MTSSWLPSLDGSTLLNERGFTEEDAINSGVGVGVVPVLCWRTP